MMKFIPIINEKIKKYKVDIKYEKGFKPDYNENESFYDVIDSIRKYVSIYQLKNEKRRDKKL